MSLASRITPAIGTVSRRKSNDSFLYSDPAMTLLRAANEEYGHRARGN